MDEIPPPEAFEPQRDQPSDGDRLRRRLQIALALLLVAALVILAAVEGSGFIIRGDGDGNGPQPRLAMVDAAGALTWTDEFGGSAVTYSAPGVSFLFPAWSPDGNRIAAIGSGSDGGGVYVLGARAAGDQASEPLLIYESSDRPPFYLYWSPDGRQVSFLTTEPDGLALRIAPADGNGSGYIVHSGAPMYWDFVDQDRMLVHSGTGGPDGFFGEIGLDGSPFEGTDRSAGVFRAPAVSTDGRYRAYLASADGAVGEVVRESRDGSGTTRVRVFGPAAVGFSPAGNELAFVAPDQVTSGALPLPVGPLRILDPDAAEPRTLIGGNVVAYFWSPTGREIAVLRLETPDDTVTEARLETGGGPIVKSALAVVAGQEAAAGIPLLLSFVAVTDGSVRSERVVRLSELFVNQVLPFFDQYALSHRFWSPDGRSIVLPIVTEGDVTQLLVIPADGSEARAVATAEMGFWSP